jgi:hypothetical protein
MQKPEPNWPRKAPAVDSGGGAYVQGDVRLQGGTFVGRDQIGHVTVENLNMNVTYLVTGDRPNSLGPDSTLGLEVFERLGNQQQQLSQAGVEPGIAEAIPPRNLLTQMTQPSAAAGRAPGSGSMPWNSPRTGSGAQPPGPNVGNVAELTKNWAEVAPQLQQMDQLLPGPVLDLTVGGQRLDVVEVLIQQGNLALWRFRRAWARFFGGQVIGNFLGRLEWPYLPDFQPIADRARTDIEVLRGLALQQTLPGPLSGRPDLAPLLNQGRWREVLNLLGTSGTVDPDMLRFAQTEIEELGQPYNPNEVTAAFQAAEQALNQALQRQPASTAALVNLATLRAEAALYAYVVNGVADRNMLTNAHELFARAGAILGQRQDPAGRIELAKCLLAASTALPAHADLDGVDVAAAYADLQRAALSRPAQQRILWDAVRRNAARQAFIDGNGIRQARDLFAAGGEMSWAQRCDAILAGQQMFFANRGRQMQWAQTVQPIVGTWTYRTGNPSVAVSGMIVFNAEAEFHWLQDMQPLGMPPSRHISVGSYSVAGNAIYLQGMEWGQQAPQAWTPPGPGMQAPFQCRLLVQSGTPDQLLLAWPEMNSQFPCLRA